MLLAILIDKSGSSYIRHACPLSPCPHRDFLQVHSPNAWVTPAGEPVPPGRFDLFAPPPEGILITSYSSPGRQFASHTGALSIKTTFSGREIYQLEHGRFLLEKDSYFIVNQGQEYLSTIREEDSLHPGGTETFCVSFGTKIAEDVARSLQEHPWGPPPPRGGGGGPAGVLALGPPEGGNEGPPPPSGEPRGSGFLQQVYRNVPQITEQLAELRRSILAPQGCCCLEEQSVSLMESLLGEHQRIVAEARGLEALPRSERVEVYQNLLCAREYIASTLENEGGLEEWAAVAGMSRYHFLRLFKQVFMVTPHQYLIRSRLARARDLLLHSRKSVTEVALEAGFNSSSHFTTSFREHFGQSPRDLRHS